ncbi:multicopper oxidase domain-containing protein [[Limnothrix rosea] IAM M-220]|uniref:multicopper oxidase domain-containing protein n=1 Tax=[Limnothrix rosea] IAM M-220 TaxID=454133 RepID=UPI00095ACEA8|nr:multicopper oxidase domain-containing protein [[Limnothrix rosea] IAM M-220]OKH19509.1 copper oxidase [[Limnothrix rosea] IAM M-220]
MSKFPRNFFSGQLDRRHFFLGGLAGFGVSAIAAAAYRNFWAQPLKANAAQIPPVELDRQSIEQNGFDPMQVLRDFNYGEVIEEEGRKIRVYHLEANSTEINLNAAIKYISWNINRRVPGPTLRATEGDRLRIIFHNADGHSHTLHFHGTHPEEMDGVKPVRHGKTMVYEFDAMPYGVHLYHCHVAPVTRHIGKGLFGMFIIDPPEGRPPADEMVLVMGGYDINNDEKNELYAFNGIPNVFRDRPIPIVQNQLVRLYILNMIEFDVAVTFHIHANFFQLYRTGRTLTPNEESDVVTMGTAERHILEFAYPFTGKYMFHPHQDYIAEHGCMGFFDVLSPSEA